MQSDSFAQMERLLLPAYLLTGSHEQAAQCVLQACEDCADIHEATFEALKKAVVGAAVRRVDTDLKNSLAEGPISTAKCGEVANLRREQPMLTGASFRSALLELNAFQRATLVLRFYERYPVSEVAALLRVSREMVEDGWQQALRILLSKLVPVLTDVTASDGDVDLEDQTDHMCAPVFGFRVAVR